MSDKDASAKDDEQQPLILVVDDFEDNREMYAEYLRHVGYRVAEAIDGNDAIEKANSLSPDAVLMDLSLPGVDGWEVTRRLKKDERTKLIPIIAVSGHTMVQHEERAMACGCDAFVAKPSLPQEVAGQIRRALGKSKSFKLP